jgi:hypothetical protein
MRQKLESSLQHSRIDGKARSPDDRIPRGWLYPFHCVAVESLIGYLVKQPSQGLLLVHIRRGGRGLLSVAQYLQTHLFSKDTRSMLPYFHIPKWPVSAEGLLITSGASNTQHGKLETAPFSATF